MLTIEADQDPFLLPPAGKKPLPKVAGKHPLNGRCKRATELRPSWAVSKENKRETEGNDVNPGRRK